MSVSDLEIEELRSRIYDEDPAELLNFSLRDSEVSLFLTGSWKGSLQGNFGISRSPLGFAFASPETPLLFTQEADLTLSLWINNRWFVEANFQDDYVMNTYRAGYRGLSGEFLQYAGIGNTGLNFPSFPYLDLGGDSTSSFGFYSLMGSDELSIHTLLRYDAASRDERVFMGGRERTYSYIQLENFIRGTSFVLPDIDIDSGITVYFEDEKGSLRDSSGRRWRFAQSNEYAAGKGLLELSIRPEGMVAVSYSSNGISRPWNESMGNYDDTSPGKFLYDVQKWFDPGRTIELEKYPQCGGTSSSLRPGEVTIGNVTALVIRQPGTFSPFERHNRYDAPSSTSEHAALVRISSGTAIDGFEIVPLGVNAIAADIPLYITAVSQRGIYELLPAGGSYSPRDPQTLWPLADMYPEIYLPPAASFSGDCILRFTNFSGNAGYFIGTDAIPGSIQIWRSGVQDTNFNYNASTGEVILHGAAGYNEIIRITFLKNSYEFRTGSIAAGLGAVYQRETSPFSAQTALGIRWNLGNNNSFTEEGTSSAGTAGLSGKALWDYDFFKANVTGGFAFEQTDTTGLYRIAGMEGNETILGLPPETSFLSQPPSAISGLTNSNRADLVYRNYYNNSMFGSTLMPVSWNANVITDLNRPYPVKDPLLGDSQTLAAEFSLNRIETWTGFQVPLDVYSQTISRAVEIEIPFRFYNFSGDTANFELVVQIGSLSGEDFAFTENPLLVWQQPLFQKGEANFNSDPRIARFILNEEDRLKLGDAVYLRIIAVYSGTQEVSGRVLLAPPIVRAASFRPVIFDGSTVRSVPDFTFINQVTAWETIEIGQGSLEAAYSGIINRLHPEEKTQRILKVEWKNMEAGISAGVDGRIGEIPLSDYRELSFFVKIGEPSITGTLEFYIADNFDSIFNNQLEASIPLNAFNSDQWSKVTIRYQGSSTGVSVDGRNIQSASFRYRQIRRNIDRPEGRSSYAVVLINPQGATLPDGEICIDEIILEDSLLIYRMNAGGAAEYSKSGTLLSFRGMPVLSDFLISTVLESEFRSGAYQGLGISGSMFNRMGAEISLFGMRIHANLFSSAARDDFLWSVDHGISGTTGAFSFRENFNASVRERTAGRSLNLAFSSDFYARFIAETLYDLFRSRQRWNLGLGYRSQRNFIPSVAVNTQAAWAGNRVISENDGYGKFWVQTWKTLFPDSGRGANIRNTSANIIITQNSTPVGANVTLEGSTNFTGANSLTRLEHSVFLDVPVAIRRVALDFRAGRGFKRHLNIYGNNFSNEGRLFFESIGDFSPAWKIFPGYSLFSPKLNDAMEKIQEGSSFTNLAQYTSITDHFSTRINFPHVYSIASFVVPSVAAVRLERVLEQKLDTGTDTLNFGASLGFTAINMFGLMGYKPIFNFYYSDEFIYGIESAVAFPKNENASWRIRSVFSAGFRGLPAGSFDGIFSTAGVLNFSNTLTLHSGGYWLETFNVAWTAPNENSLLGIFYNWIALRILALNSWMNLSPLFSSDYQQLKKESLELTIDKTGDYLRWSIMAGHESIIRIFGRLEFTTFAKLRFNEDRYREIFTVDTLIGTTLRINF